MKQVIAVLRPTWGKRNGKDRMDWYYFTGFSTPTPLTAQDPIVHRLDTSTKLCDAYVFDSEDNWLLYTTRERIEREFREHANIFPVDDKALFEARLKDE